MTEMDLIACAAFFGVTFLGTGLAAATHGHRTARKLLPPCLSSHAKDDASRSQRQRPAASLPPRPAAARLLVVILCACVAPLDAGSAYANAGYGDTTCAHGGNPGVSGCVNGHYGETYLGASSVWADNNMNVLWSSGRFIGNVLWV